MHPQVSPFAFLVGAQGSHRLTIFGTLPDCESVASHTHLVFHGSISLKIKYLRAYEYKCDYFCALDCGVEITQQLQRIMHQALSRRQRQSVREHRTKSHFPPDTCTFLPLSVGFQTLAGETYRRVAGRRVPSVFRAVSLQNIEQKASSRLRYGAPSSFSLWHQTGSRKLS